MISVIIPTYNEAENIGNVIRHLLNETDAINIQEIIVADGHSTDATKEMAIKAGAKFLLCTNKGRARQMNEASRIALGNIFYFLHADSVPPKGYSAQIIAKYNAGYGIGCYQLSFDYNHWFLKANCWFTRFNVNAVRFGDQSLFVHKDIFTKSGGFNEHLMLCEDQEIIHRLKNHGRFVVMQDRVITSARKYLENGVYKMQLIFYLIYFLYKAGVPQHKLLRLYRKLIKESKI